MSKHYDDNLICEYKLAQWEKDIIDFYKRVGKYIPITTYDMVQTGYPSPDHGEMVPRYSGDLIEPQISMGPSHGMWCKVEDVVALIEKIDPNYFTND